MPGIDARMRVSSVIALVSSCGTLRSARMNTRLPARPHWAMRLNDVIASSRLNRGRPARATIATCIQLVERPAGGGDEQERERGVDDRGETAQSHPHPQRQREAEMLTIAFSDRSRVRREWIGHDRKRCRSYFAAISAIVASSIRLEKPHSLSYHAETLTSRPETFVSVASNTEERASWLKSTDTRGPVLQPSSPASGPDSDAAFMIALTSSTVVSRAAMNDRSTIETLIVGTRIA